MENTQHTVIPVLRIYDIDKTKDFYIDWLGFGIDWELHLRLFKRKGPTHEGHIVLPSIPDGLHPILTPRLMKPSVLLAARRAHDEEVSHAVGRTAPRPPSVRRVAAH